MAESTDRQAGGAAHVRLGAALGLGAHNAQYLGSRLAYDRDPEPSFDPVRNPRLIREFALRAVVYVMIFILGGTASLILGLFLAISGHFLGALEFWLIGGILAGIVLVAVFVFLPVPVLLSEWKFFVDDKAAAAPETVDHITWSLQRRQIPLDGMAVRRLRRPGDASRDYLELRKSLFTGFISCFSYGADLYVGWTLWMWISPMRYLVLAARAVFRSLHQGMSDPHTTLRYDYARAMREAMHSAAREGVDVAAGQVPAQGRGAAAALPVTVSEIDF